MEFSSLFSSNLVQNAAGLTILVALVSYLATFISSIILARRRDKLDLVNRRLNEFYGPLYVASQAGNIAYRSLLKKQGKTQSFPILDSEMKEWMLWMTTIFMPLNDEREKIIIKKAYLIVEEQMPQCLLDFVTHVVGYKAVIAKWAEGDYTERRSTIGWPPEFDIYVARSYAVLKAKQTYLLHSFTWRLWHRVIDHKPH
jgi:amino acid transporter